MALFLGLTNNRRSERALDGKMQGIGIGVLGFRGNIMLGDPYMASSYEPLLHNFNTSAYTVVDEA
jgi:hypothetical protein